MVVSGLRIVTYIQASPSRYLALVRIPPVGVIAMLLAYLSFVLALQFIHVSIPGDAHWEAIGIRAGWLSIGQTPLIILLAGKYNIIGFLTGVGYERLNVFHRWVARTLLLTATLHFGYQSYGWNRLGLWQLEWATDTCAPTGKHQLLAKTHYLTVVRHGSIYPSRLDERIHDEDIPPHIL